jgi:putative ABC transport system permease protein
MNTGLLLHTLLGLLLLVIPAGLLYLLERPVLKTFGIAVGRAIVQLALLCLIVWGLIRINSPWLLLLWLVAIAAYSGWLVVKRCKQEVKKWMLPVSAGLLIGVSLIAFWLLGLVFPVRIFDAHWFVPVTALLTGHATAMIIRGLSTYLSAFQADEQQYEFLRGNGLAHFKALQPFLRRSLLAVISPTMANLSVLGLTSMPLLLVGILLGGILPLHAFLLMIGMIAGCVSASVLSLALSILCYELSQRHIRQTAA